jgi:hypothetical protein
MRVAISDKPEGPYKDTGKRIGPGHNPVILGPDGKTWFNVYHSWKPERTRRQICMHPIVWTNEGPKTYQPTRGKKAITIPLSR